MKNEGTTLDHPGAVALAESVMRLAEGLQDDVDQNGEDWRKVYGGLRMIQHASASLLGYVRAFLL